MSQLPLLRKDNFLEDEEGIEKILKHLDL